MPTKRMMQTGTIESLNVSPKGSFEGLLLKTSKGRVQVNFAPELSGYGAAQVKLKKGMLVSGGGMRKPATGQTIVIEAEQVNGITLEKH